MFELIIIYLVNRQKMSVDFLVWDKAIDDAQVDKLKLYDQIQNAIDTEGDSAELRWRLAKVSQRKI